MYVYKYTMLVVARVDPVEPVSDTDTLIGPNA